MDVDIVQVESVCADPLDRVLVRDVGWLTARELEVLMTAVKNLCVEIGQV
jgi:hypothetical protein